MASKKLNLKILLSLVLIFSGLFAVNLYIKKDYFGERTISTNEVWLSGVSELYTKIWFEEGAINNNFAMIRTFDSIEMRDLKDREVYTSFLPTCLFLPHIVSRIFNIEPSLKFIQGFACLFHFLGTLLASLICYLLCQRQGLSSRKQFLYALFTGTLYIFGYKTFETLDFAYYTDTSIYPFYLLFLLTEFIDDNKKRLWTKAPLILIGLSHEWFFASITVVPCCLN